MSHASRAELIRQAWKVSCGGRFSEKGLVDSVVELAEDPMALVQFLVASLLQVEVQEAAGINLP